jgi:dipeptidyl aminopeptidase/acylaminoacyl peptidase
MFKDFVVFEVDGIAIIGQLFLPDKEASYPGICLCHGAPSGNPPDPNDGGYPALAERICAEGFATFFFNFRGTGDSGGNIDILGWTRDLQAVVDYLWILDNVDKSHLFLVGFSAGAATSVYVASKDIRVSGVAACACPADFSLFTGREEPQSIIDHYRDIGAIRDEDFPPSLERWFDNLKQVIPVNHVDRIAPRPLLLVHGSQDETVPVSHAYRLYNKAFEPKKLVIIDGAGHRLRQEARAIDAVLEWLKSDCQITG